MTRNQKKEFIKAVKRTAASDCPWMVKCYQNPNGHSTPWTQKVIAAALKRHGVTV